jgi:hypothetical protein
MFKVVFFNEQHTDIPYLLHAETAESLFVFGETLYGSIILKLVMKVKY